MPRLERIWGDAGDAGKPMEWARAEADWALEIVAKEPGATAFVVLPKRWIVERTFAWLGSAAA